MSSKADGVPILLLSLNSIVMKAHHSGMLLSRIFSEITTPQLLQITSPDSGSVMTVLSPFLLHIGQIITQEGEYEGSPCWLTILFFTLPCYMNSAWSGTEQHITTRTAQQISKSRNYYTITRDT
ncbi:MAG: hypothetical protein WBL88_04065 [Nitrososphaeraceae archaeon]